MGRSILDNSGRLREMLEGEASEDAKAELFSEYARLWNTLCSMIHAFMEAVDVSGEARLEGRSSRRHRARIAEIANRFADDQGPAHEDP